MTDKQIIMTGKEQIKCKYMFQDKEKFDGKPYCVCFCELCEDLPPCDDNCQIYEDFKQLAHKTQECENLKSESFTRESLISMQEKEIDCYRNVFEEIEEYCNTKRENLCTEICNRSSGFCIERNCYPVRDLTYILDIIHKAKGE